MPVSRPTLERRVRSSITISSSEALPGALADAVHRALDLARAGGQARERVRHRQAQVVVAVDRHDDVLQLRHQPVQVARKISAYSCGIV